MLVASSICCHSLRQQSGHIGVAFVYATRTLIPGLRGLLGLGYKLSPGYFRLCLKQVFQSISLILRKFILQKQKGTEAEFPVNLEIATADLRSSVTFGTWVVLDDQIPGLSGVLCQTEVPLLKLRLLQFRVVTMCWLIGCELNLLCPAPGGALRARSTVLEPSPELPSAQGCSCTKMATAA